MIDTLQQLIADYGYVAVTLGCLLEGEASILLGVFAASRDILTVEGVVIAAVAGTIVGDNVCFHIGRRMGRPALARRPDWQERVVFVERLLERYGAVVIIGFRFLYGIRYITPFVLGSLDISPWRFLALEATGAILWALLVAVIGVYLADAVTTALAHIQNAEQALLIAVLLAGVLGYLIYRFRRWRRSRFPRA